MTADSPAAIDTLLPRRIARLVDQIVYEPGGASAEPVASRTKRTSWASPVTRTTAVAGGAARRLGPIHRVAAPRSLLPLLVWELGHRGRTGISGGGSTAPIAGLEGSARARRCRQFRRFGTARTSLTGMLPSSVPARREGRFRPWVGLGAEPARGRNGFNRFTASRVRAPEDSTDDRGVPLVTRTPTATSPTRRPQSVVCR